MRRTLLCLALVAASCGESKAPQEDHLAVVGAGPRGVSAPVDGAITLRFDRPLRRDSVTQESLRVFGRWSGPAAGVVSLLDADVSVFLNDGLFRFRRADRAAVGRRASPSEPADFDGDGHVDLAVVNIADNTVSILMGRGDGRFDLARTVPVGQTPRGISVLDADGDGDTDIAVASFGASVVTPLTNDGAGHFVAGPSLDAGIAGEWALAAADMDADGIMDLVVGGQESQRIAVLRGRGDGGFEPLGSQDAGGATWMLVAGDLDRDGREDVAAVNGRSNNAAVLRGDGRGGLEAPRVYPIAPFGLASDLGDMDGDGDLDWLTSSFTGEWRLFENGGDGGFDVRTLFRAPRAASCALPFDADADGDLDLALIDEVADEVILFRNEG